MSYLVPKTNTPLKINGGKMTFSFGMVYFQGLFPGVSYGRYLPLKYTRLYAPSNRRGGWPWGFLGILRMPPPTVSSRQKVVEFLSFSNMRISRNHGEEYKLLLMEKILHHLGWLKLYK